VPEVIITMSRMPTAKSPLTSPEIVTVTGPHVRALLSTSNSLGTG
jgi:hypothetical protein